MKNKILINIAVLILRNVDKSKLEFPFSWDYYIGKIYEYLKQTK